MLQADVEKRQLDPSMTMRLETYLLQLSEVQGRWQSVLTQMQRSAQLQETSRLQTLEAQVLQVQAELQELVNRREEMIEEARQTGWRVSSLRGLAERLPAWNRPRFRAAFNAAKNQCEQLRRAYVATWVLLHQTAQHYQDISLIFMQGTSRRDVYELGTGAISAMSGGQLLNEAL